MRLAIIKEEREIATAEYILSSSYSEMTEEIKTEIIEIINAVTAYVNNILDESSSQKDKNALKEFFYP